MKLIISACGSMPQVSLIKDFQEYNVKIIGIDCNPLSVGFKFCDNYYVIPKATDNNFLPKMLEICGKEKPDAIVISPDEELMKMAQNRTYFESLKIKLLIPKSMIVGICNDKWFTYHFFKNNKIPTPLTRLYEGFNGPSIIKPRQGRGSSGIFRVNNLIEEIFYKDRMENYIIQKFIEGKEYTVDILSDWNSNPISIIIRERIEVESGICTKGKIVFDKEITKYVKQIVKKLGLVGMSCIQCIRGKEGLKFIEINLRFGGGSVLSRRADPTIIPNYLRLIEGKKLLKPKKPKQLTFLRYYSEVIEKNEKM